MKKLRVQLGDDAPLLVSFFPRQSDDIYFKRIYRTANFFRTILGREKIELGDELRQLSFAHWFTEAEIKAEFKEAGFTPVYYSEQEYGHAVGLAA